VQGFLRELGINKSYVMVNTNAPGASGRNHPLRDGETLPSPRETDLMVGGLDTGLEPTMWLYDHELPARRGRNLMAIVFKLDSTTGEGTFIRVLRDGRPFGKILDAMGLYRFYEGDRERFGDAALQDADLARLKVAIQSRYDGR